MPRPKLTQLELTRRRGRRAGIGVFALLIIAFVGVCTVQILRQVFSPPVLPTEIGCHEGIHRLIAAVRRARAAAGKVTRGERQALARFRSELEPEWSTRSALSGICRNDRAAKRALTVVDQYRYAEEHAVRYESAGLTHLRQKIRRIEAEFPAQAPSPHAH